MSAEDLRAAWMTVNAVVGLMIGWYGMQAYKAYRIQVALRRAEQAIAAAKQAIATLEASKRDR